MKMAGDVWVPVCLPPRSNCFQGAELLAGSLVLPRSTLDSSHWCVSEGEKYTPGTFELSTSLFGELGEKSLRSGGERINMDITQVESCKGFPCHQQHSSCVNPMLEQEQAERRCLCFHQQLHSCLECQRMMLPCWRPAVFLNSIL